jgi:hypothetical protein
MKVKITIDGEYFSEGSILRGDRRGGAEGIGVHVDVESDLPPETVAGLVRETEAGCFTLGAIRNPTPVTIAAALNGIPVELSKPD